MDNEHIEKFHINPSNYPVEATFRRLSSDLEEYIQISIDNGYLKKDESEQGKWVYDDGEFLIRPECLSQWCSSDNTEDDQDKYLQISVTLDDLNKSNKYVNF